MARGVGRPMAVLVLSDEERSYLERQARRRRVARSLSDRCRMILRCADGLTNKAVAIELGVHEHTVGKWRRRFLKERIEGLSDEPRPGRPRTLSDEKVAAVIERTLETTPADATHWSLRSMARESGLSHTTVRRIWAAFSVQPHRSETFKLSSDPLFVDKVRDIIGLYLSPPDRALVLCVDEKSQIQALDRTQPVLPMLADLPRACDVGSKRNAKGHTTSWIGYKLHVDTADGGIPISCIMTSASTHDSQVAIPLGTLTAGRVENLYDLMDAAYDSIEIWAHCILLGHKPIIDVNPRRSVEMQEALKQEKKARRTLGLVFPEERRCVVRSGSERINGRLKDEFGGRHVRVRGYDKVLAHLMFGMTVLTASQLMRLIVPPI